MDKYSKQAGDASYDSDADADDEFERSMVGSPSMQKEFADDQSDHPSESEEEHDSLDGEDTPTTQGWTEREGRSPRGNIMEWAEADVADFISSLSSLMKPYCQTFVDEGVTGDALCALQHDELRELGVSSVGHRLTILKAVYEQKIKTGVKIQEGDYVPLSAENDKSDMAATQDDIARIIESIRLRDQRIIKAETELMAMKQDLDRIADENRRLREETLHVVKRYKDAQAPLPDPNGSTLPSPREPEIIKALNPTGNTVPPTRNGEKEIKRRFSVGKRLFLGSAPKQPSPTHPPVHPPFSAPIRDDGGALLEASAAATAASTHLTASMTQTSPHESTSQPLSPASPAYPSQPPSGGSHHSILQTRSTRNYDEPGSATSWTTGTPATIERPMSTRPGRRPTPSPREDEPPASAREK